MGTTMLGLNPPIGSDLDWTAIKNFAALRGQLRVSLTPRCNINCWFCHNEGDIPPRITRKDRSQQPRRRNLTSDDFSAIIAALVDEGLNRVYFTGGEPLISKDARPILQAIPKHSKAQGTYTLITNGLLIRKNLGWLRTVQLDKVKVSLHYFSDASLKAIADTDHPVSAILDGIDLARELFGTVELNCMLQQQNQHEVLDILDYALERRIGVQFIELVDTGFNAEHRNDAIDAIGLIRHLRTLTSNERVDVIGVGQGKRVFTIDGLDIEVIHKRLGRYHVGQCGACPMRQSCIEGFWALRLDHSGLLAPCLLREDLRLDLKPFLDDGKMSTLPGAVARHIEAFTEGRL